MPPTPRFPVAAFLLTLLLVGCDSNDEGEERFGGTWSFASISADADDVTGLVLARYEELIVTFVAEEDRFVLFGDVEGTAEDLRLEGFYSVSESSDALRLELDEAIGTFDFISSDYQFLGANEVRLIAEGVDAEAWVALLDIGFGDVEDVRITLAR